MAKTTEWTRKMDETLLELASKYPHGTKGIAWAKLVKDPMWRWPVGIDQARTRYYRLNSQTPPSNPIKRKQVSIPKDQPYILPYCPHCGGALGPIISAMSLVAAMNGAIHASQEG